MLFILPGLFYIACEQVLEPGKIDDHKDDRDRITSISIDSVKLRSSRNDVESILGSPDIVGLAEGFYSYFLWEYTKGVHIGLTVLFLEIINDTDDWCGPVTNFSLSKNYKGKTADGIGIGSKISEVHKIYGEPSNFYENDDQRSETYIFEISYMTFQYTQNGVSGITIGSTEKP